MLRTRPVPSAIHHSNALTLQSWRSVFAVSHYSSLQEQRGPQDNGREAAVLEWRKQEKKSKTQGSLDNPNSELPKASKLAHPPKMVPAVHTGKRQAPNNQPKVLQNGSRKRKADSSEDHRPARRQRGGPGPQRQRPTNLKDEAWLRREMHVPTTSDYPDVPEQFFKNPKLALNSAVQGLATLDSAFVTLAPEVFQCTLRYESIKRTEIVVAEGRSKVSFL